MRPENSSTPSPQLQNKNLDRAITERLERKNKASLNKIMIELIETEFSFNTQLREAITILDKSTDPKYQIYRDYPKGILNDLLKVSNSLIETLTGLSQDQIDYLTTSEGKKLILEFLNNNPPQIDNLTAVFQGLDDNFFQAFAQSVKYNSTMLECATFLKSAKHPQIAPTDQQILDSGLIVGVQRVPRYKLLLDAMLKYSQNNASLESALNLILNGATKINESITGKIEQEDLKDNELKKEKDRRTKINDNINNTLVKLFASIKMGNIGASLKELSSALWEVGSTKEEHKKLILNNYAFQAVELGDLESIKSTLEQKFSKEPITRLLLDTIETSLIFKRIPNMINDPTELLINKGLAEFISGMSKKASVSTSSPKRPTRRTGIFGSVDQNGEFKALTELIRGLIKEKGSKEVRALLENSPIFLAAKTDVLQFIQSDLGKYTSKKGLSPEGTSRNEIKNILLNLVGNAIMAKALQGMSHKKTLEDIGSENNPESQPSPKEAELALFVDAVATKPLKEINFDQFSLLQEQSYKIVESLVAAQLLQNSNLSKNIGKLISDDGQMDKFLAKAQNSLGNDKGKSVEDLAGCGQREKLVEHFESKGYQFKDRNLLISNQSKMTSLVNSLPHNVTLDYQKQEALESGRREKLVEHFESKGYRFKDDDRKLLISDEREMQKLLQTFQGLDHCKNLLDDCKDLLGMSNIQMAVEYIAKHHNEAFEVMREPDMCTIAKTNNADLFEFMTKIKNLNPDQLKDIVDYEGKSLSDLMVKRNLGQGDLGRKESVDEPEGAKESPLPSSDPSGSKGRPLAQPRGQSKQNS